MQKSRQTLLALLRSALWGTPADVPADVDWNTVLKIARQQTLIGLVADAVQILPEDKRPGAEMMQKLQIFMMRNIQSHMLITSRLGETVELLRSAGIEPVLFKGHGLAANYPDPMSRQCGDIDLYVGKKAYDKAVKVCADAFGEEVHDSESSKHYHTQNKGVTIEIHKIAEVLPGLFEDRRYQSWTVEMLTSSNVRKTDIEGVAVTLPPIQFDPIYVMNHAWHHFVNGGVGLRQFCDWAVYLHKFHSKIDVAVLEADLRSFGLLKVWHLFAGFAVKYLDLPSEECPLYSDRYDKAAGKMLEVIWAEGNFGHHSVRHKELRPEGYVQGKLHSLKQTTKRFILNFSVYPTYMLKSFAAFFRVGITAFFQGLFK